jgi:hypothetical protein
LLVVDGPAPRTVARSVAFDPDAPGFRIAMVRTKSGDWWLHREAGTSGGNVAWKAEHEVVGGLFPEMARELLVGWDPATIRMPQGSAATAAWLADQGAASPEQARRQGGHGER